LFFNAFSALIRDSNRIEQAEDATKKSFSNELRGDFEFAIDHYLSVCREAGVAPQKQAGGRILLRLPAETHAEALIAAQAAGLSLNGWLQNAVRQQLNT